MNIRKPARAPHAGPKRGGPLLPQAEGFYLWYRLDLGYLDVGAVRVVADTRKHRLRLAELKSQGKPAQFHVYQRWDGIWLTLYHQAHDHMPSSDENGVPLVDGYRPFDFDWLVPDEDLSCPVPETEMSSEAVTAEDTHDITPPPWHDSECWRIAPDGTCSLSTSLTIVAEDHAEPVIATVWGHHASPGRVKANARLIAAAPKLLKACTGALKAIRAAGKFIYPGASDEIHEILMRILLNGQVPKILEAAITRATEGDLREAKMRPQSANLSAQVKRARKCPVCDSLHYAKDHVNEMYQCQNCGHRWPMDLTS